jgi:hypothetical protein
MRFVERLTFPRWPSVSLASDQTSEPGYAVGWADLAQKCFGQGSPASGADTSDAPRFVRNMSNSALANSKALRDISVALQDNGKKSRRSAEDARRRSVAMREQAEAARSSAVAARERATPIERRGHFQMAWRFS